MNKKYNERYYSMSDAELIDRILTKPSDSIAADFLILEKYNPLLWEIYKDVFGEGKFDYFDDCKSELKIYLMGKDLCWKKLAGIEYKECISTWLGTTAKRHFRATKSKLIDISSYASSIDAEEPEKPKIQIPVDIETLYDDQESMAIVNEAITTLKENERFCILMDMKGYAHKEIAEMLRIKWEREGIKKKSNKKGIDCVIPDSGNVNVYIQRAKKKIIKYYNKVYQTK